MSENTVKSGPSCWRIRYKPLGLFWSSRSYYPAITKCGRAYSNIPSLDMIGSAPFIAAIDRSKPYPDCIVWTPIILEEWEIVEYQEVAR